MMAQTAPQGLTAVKGLKVGHYTLAARPTGCTVILAEKGAVAGVDVRGAAPGTRETNLLDPVNTVQMVHGILLSGAVFRDDSDSVALNAAQSGLLDLFAQRAEGANVAPLPLPAVGAWAWPLDCVAVVEAGDFSAVPGLGASPSGGPEGGNDAYYPPAERSTWRDHTLPFCGVYNGDVSVSFYALGGGRWVEPSVTAFAGATTTSVDGIDSVVLSPTDYGKTRVDVFDGPNWATFYVSHASNAGVMAQALVAALDTTAAE